MSISIQKTATGHKHEAQRHADITNRKYRHADVNTTNTSDIHKSDAQRRGINSVDTVYTQAHRLLTSTQQSLHCSVEAKTQSLHNELHMKSSFKYSLMNISVLSLSITTGTTKQTPKPH